MNTEEEAKAYEMAIEAARKELGVDRKEWKVVQQVLFNIFPELSEDEMSRRWILAFLCDGLRKADPQFKEQFKTAIAYIEKQKESLHISKTCKENADSFTDEDKRVREELVAFFKEMQYGAWHEKYWHDIEIAHILAYLEKQKDLDKMIVISPEVWDNAISDAYENGKKEGEKQKEQKLAEKQDYSGLNDLERAILRGFLSAGVENVPVTIIKETAKECLAQMKPAEWSEVELEFRGEKVKVKRPFFRDDKGRGYSTTEQDEEVAWNALRAWCEKKGVSLYDLYPKEEWSDEDEGELQNAIDALEFLGKKGVYKSESGYNAALQAASWLKNITERFNLQPKEEWTEEDERKYQCIRSILLTDGDKKVGSWKYSEILEWYEKRGIGRYTNSESHWKPSEEQMGALDKAIPVCMGVVRCDEIAPLESLYEQLKKL